MSQYLKIERFYIVLWFCGKSTYPISPLLATAEYDFSQVMSAAVCGSISALLAPSVSVVYISGNVGL